MAKKKKTPDPEIFAPKIVLNTVPDFETEETTSQQNINSTISQNINIEAGKILDNLNELIIIPDRWYIKLPEDKELVPLINFYKEDKIIASLPLNDENLKGLMPVLDSLYERPETKIKPPVTKRIKKWAKKHKFSAALAILVITLVIVSIGITLATSRGLY